MDTEASCGAIWAPRRWWLSERSLCAGPISFRHRSRRRCYPSKLVGWIWWRSGL